MSKEKVVARAALSLQVIGPDCYPLGFFVHQAESAYDEGADSIEWRDKFILFFESMLNADSNEESSRALVNFLPTYHVAKAEQQEAQNGT